MDERVVRPEVLGHQRVSLRGITRVKHQTVLVRHEPVKLLEPLRDPSPGDTAPGSLVRHTYPRVSCLLLRRRHSALVLRQRLAVFRVVFLLAIEMFASVRVSAQRQIEFHRYTPVPLRFAFGLIPLGLIAGSLRLVVEHICIGVVAFVVVVCVHVEVVFERDGDLVVWQIQCFNEPSHRVPRPRLLFDHQRQVLPRHPTAQRAVHRRQHGVHLRQVVLDQRRREFLGLSFLLQRPDPGFLVPLDLFEFLSRGIGALLAL